MSKTHINAIITETYVVFLIFPGPNEQYCTENEINSTVHTQCGMIGKISKTILERLNQMAPSCALQEMRAKIVNFLLHIANYPGVHLKFG